MSNRLKKHLLNGGIPYPCRLDFIDGAPCTRQFADSRSREMHEKDFNHKRKNPKMIRHQSANTNTRAVIVHSTAGSTTTKKAEDKVHFIIDFLTPIMGRCSNCEDEGEIIPLTGKCILCDPVLTTLAIIREEIAQKKAEKKAEVIDQINAWANEAPWQNWHGGI